MTVCDASQLCSRKEGKRARVPHAVTRPRASPSPFLEKLALPPPHPSCHHSRGGRLNCCGEIYNSFPKSCHRYLVPTSCAPSPGLYQAIKYGWQ